MLFQLQHVFWGPWKGRIKERRKRGKLQLGDRGGMIKQGKHSLGHLLIEGNTVCSKAMLILLLCHPQVHPLCSNAPHGPPEWIAGCVPPFTHEAAQSLESLAP